MKLLKETLMHFKPYWKGLLIAFACSLVGGVFTIFPPVLTGKIVDGIVSDTSGRIIGWMIAGVMFSFLFKVVFESLQELLQVRIGLDVITDMQLRAFRRLHKTPMSFFTTTPRGDMLYRLTHDVESVQNLNNTVIPRFVQQLISAVAAFTAVISLYWPAAVIMVGVFAIYLYPSFKIGTKVRKMGAVQRDMSADMYSHLQESIESIRLVRTFQTQSKEIKTQEEKLTKWKNFSIRLALIGKVNWRLGNLFNIATPGVVMLVGGLSVWQDKITIGTLVATLSFIPIMFMPVRSLAENALIIQQAIPALQRIYEYFDLPQEHNDNLPGIGQIKGSIQMDDIWFKYPGTEHFVLKGVTLKMESGTHIGIVGTSGGGKSTLVQVLLGLFNPDKGSVHIDHKNLNEYNRNSFRQQVGVVSQETFLLNSTLRKNLLYGRPEASQAELDEACEAAGLTELITSLTEGYETIVGERGLKLSGGQRQRVALARAILRHPPVLIFDEATSSLDGETEERVQASLEELIPGRTTITIAHRLVTVRNADKIILLDKGVAAEEGTHEELLALRGQYYQLYMAQYSELEKESAV
ncbi:ATP-binding cassette subfamily B protein/subfamily B ATP-binding cassette protein MsbA [Peribacillus deserti]|uniref:ATP-binding cassette subfamily B protein/subfamily B ATP-binding cassette protein MsbA n=1 Tax=Peribacillus deserti TaxID=673318 RepID=A0ABS2QKE3_9BACI|nr:ABC transporter ATP-binding protein [Peribacillus deserti]MBM7693430.1 ATP-binding cassette subfamily B protein/subfamily B ATP-binding cassette protein MsbA [Peribacillus deserti]